MQKLLVMELAHLKPVLMDLHIRLMEIVRMVTTPIQGKHGDLPLMEIHLMDTLMVVVAILIGHMVIMVDMEVAIATAIKF